MLGKKDETIPEKPKISVVLDEDTFQWLQKNVRNRSAFIRELIHDFRVQQTVDPKLQSVAATMEKLKGLGLILVPGVINRSLIELGLKHDPETVTKLFQESGRFLGSYFASYTQDQNWIKIFRQILTDLFLDVPQISVAFEDESILSLHFVSSVHSEQALFLIGIWLEEALNRLGFKISEQSIVTGMLSQKYSNLLI